MFKTVVLKSSICDDEDGYILGKETKAISNKTISCGAANNSDIKAIFKHRALFIGCKSQIGNIEIDKSKKNLCIYVAL